MFGTEYHGYSPSLLRHSPFATQRTAGTFQLQQWVSKSIDAPQRASDGRDDFGLHLRSSEGTVCNRSREVVRGAGDVVLVSAAETLVVASPSPARFCSLWVPRAELAAHVVGLDDRVSQRVAPDTEALRYLIGYVRYLEEQQKFADAGLAPIGGIALGPEHEGEQVAHVDGGGVAEGRGLRAARLQAIKRYVAGNLDHRGLTVSAMAARHRVAPRYVQRLFEGEGTTFSEYVLDQRLARALQLLADPARSLSE